MKEKLREKSLKQPGLHKINEMDKPLGSLRKKAETIQLKVSRALGGGGCITKTRQKEVKHTSSSETGARTPTELSRPFEWP